MDSKINVLLNKMFNDELMIFFCFLCFTSFVFPIEGLFKEN